MFQRLATLDLGVILLPEEIAAEDVAAGYRVLAGAFESASPDSENVKVFNLPEHSDSAP